MCCSVSFPFVVDRTRCGYPVVAMLAVCSFAINSLQMVLLMCSLAFVVSTNAVLACPLLFYLF